MEGTYWLLFLERSLGDKPAEVPVLKAEKFQAIDPIRKAAPNYLIQPIAYAPADHAVWQEIKT
jgi:hypothetical protein